MLSLNSKITIASFAVATSTVILYFLSKKRIAASSKAALGKLDAVIAAFSYDKGSLLKLKASFLDSMHRGLQSEGQDILMVPSFVQQRPTGKESGTAWAIDLGGTNLRVLKVTLKGNGLVENVRDLKCMIPVDIMRGSGEQLFDLIAAQLKECGAGNKEVVGFTFSFPVSQSTLRDGTLLRWTKGFTSTGVVGENVTDLLVAALLRKGVDVRVVALVNDTVGTLAAACYEDSRCLIGLILGTGSNASYSESLSNVTKLSRTRVASASASYPVDAEMLINMEWGGFKQGLRLTEYDKSLDAASNYPGGQLFEKQISGMYLGEIVRLALLDLVKNKIIFKNSPVSAFEKATMLFETMHVSVALEEYSAYCSAAPGLVAFERTTQTLLELFGIKSPSIADLVKLAKVCSAVGTRSARLAGTGIAAIVEKLGTRGVGCVVGVDGSLFAKFPGYKEEMERTLEILDARCVLKAAADGSGKGAALIAASNAL